MTLHYTDLNRDIAQPVQPYAKPKFSLYRSVIKRALDLATLIVTAPITVPFILVLALAVWIRTGSSPFYSQKRIGKNGKVFTMWKLRTMVVDADQRLTVYLENNPDARIEWDRDQKLKADPRVTGVGQLLRKTSMDELPQLWNVFIGDMSLVGPRPMMENQKTLYPGLDYYDLRPGITGLWQISDRNQSSFAQRAGFDSQYNRELSPANDASIFFNTFAVVLRGTGY